MPGIEINRAHRRVRHCHAANLGPQRLLPRRHLHPQRQQAVARLAGARRQRRRLQPRQTRRRKQVTHGRRLEPMPQHKGVQPLFEPRADASQRPVRARQLPQLPEFATDGT